MEVELGTINVMQWRGFVVFTICFGGRFASEPQRSIVS